MTLTVAQLSFSYDTKVILNHLSLQLKKGEIGTIIGASGSGKSTFFKILAGLLPIHTGEIIIDGLSPQQRSQWIAYMMQQDLLLPWRTVLSNLMLAMELGPCDTSTRTTKEEAFVLLEELGLIDWANKYPEELSGGMRQRVSLARALLQKRPILLLDEPFGALDVGLREQMYQLLQRIQAKYQTTMLMVTHDFRDALSLSNRIFLLSQGTIYKEWQLTPALREDVHQMSHLQQELRQLLIVQS